ncbi:hypothetical protein MRB53_039002 [Persea americana]|nr:hypothetical protein MRB53_039002 [Persea americana]
MQDSAISSGVNSIWAHLKSTSFASGLRPAANPGKSMSLSAAGVQLLPGSISESDWTAWQTAKSHLDELLESPIAPLALDVPDAISPTTNTTELREARAANELISFAPLVKVDNVVPSSLGLQDDQDILKDCTRTDNKSRMIFWQRVVFGRLGRDVRSLKSIQAKTTTSLPGLDRPNSQVVRQTGVPWTSTALSRDVVVDVDLKAQDYKEINAAFSGIVSQKGPLIADAIIVLGMDFTEKDSFGRQLFRSNLLRGKSTKLFFDYQISGAANVLLKTFGSIPLAAFPEHRRIDNALLQAAERMARSYVGTSAHVNADQTGMEKVPRRCWHRTKFFADQSALRSEIKK